MKRLATSLLALPLLTVSLAMAHDRDDWRRHEDRPGWSHEHRPDWGRSQWREYHGGPDRSFDRDWRWRRERFYGYGAPHGYYVRPYAVEDYRGYGLRAPPYGCHWIRRGDDLLLTALATGVVLEVLHEYFE